MTLQSLETATPRQRKPRSLFQFLTWAGGLKSDPELRVLLDGRYGWMIRKTGMSLDDARIACMEEGFLVDNPEADCEPSINDLLELIAAEASGHKQYRVHEMLDAVEMEGRGLQTPAHGAANREVKPRHQPEHNSMEASEFKRLKKRLCLSTYALAPKLGVSLRHAYRYENGQADIPETVAKLLRMFAKHGIPEGW